MAAKRNKRKDAERWEDFKADYPCLVSVQRTSHIGERGFFAVPCNYSSNRNKFYESRDAWLAEYVFGTSGKY